MTRRAGLLTGTLLALLACGPKTEYEKVSIGKGVFEIRNPDGIFRYLSAERAHEAGVGVRIGKSPDGLVTILEVFPGSPAQEASLKTGDKILELDGKPLAGLDVQAAADKIKGPPGSTVRLKLQRMGAVNRLELRRGLEVMQFTVYPPGIEIRRFAKDESCPSEREGSCHFLVAAASSCFYSCPLSTP